MRTITIKFSNSQKNYTYLLRKDSVDFASTDTLKVLRGVQNSSGYWGIVYIVAIQEITELPKEVTSWLKVNPGKSISYAKITDNLRKKINKKLEEEKPNKLVIKLNAITFKINDLMKEWSVLLSESPLNQEKISYCREEIEKLEEQKKEILKKLNIKQGE